MKRAHLSRLALSTAIILAGTATFAASPTLSVLRPWAGSEAAKSR